VEIVKEWNSQTRNYWLWLKRILLHARESVRTAHNDDRCFVLLAWDTVSVFNGCVTYQDKGIISYTSNKTSKIWWRSSVFIKNCLQSTKFLFPLSVRGLLCFVCISWVIRKLWKVPPTAYCSQVLHFFGAIKPVYIWDLPVCTTNLLKPLIPSYKHKCAYSCCF